MKTIFTLIVVLFPALCLIVADIVLLPGPGVLTRFKIALPVAIAAGFAWGWFGSRIANWLSRLRP